MDVGRAQALRARRGADRIELKIAPAIETLRALPSGESIDFAFIDADKSGYRGYYEEILSRTAPRTG
jgi:caffeoyl-CoA O-methyltransferase